MLISEVAGTIESYCGRCPPDCLYIGEDLKVPKCRLFDKFLEDDYRCSDCLKLFDSKLRKADKTEEL